jgi:hypothetical protein
MKRRRFLTRGLELVLAVQCLPLLDMKASAMQLRPGTKPPLTEASLNALIPNESDQLRALARQAFPDMKAFIRSRFVLSAEQERALSAISSASVESIQKAVESAIAQGAKLSFSAVAGTTPSSGPVVQVTPTSAAAQDQSGCTKLLVL